MAKFCQERKSFAQAYSYLAMRLNGEGTLISSENSFLALSYSVEQETERGSKKESKFHCRKTRAGEKIPFCVLQKMRITISDLDICKKNNLKSYRKESSGKGLRTAPAKPDYSILLGVVDFLLKGASRTVAALRTLTLEIINKQPATMGGKPEGNA